MGKITLFCDSADPYVKYGLHHFIKKYGFSLTDYPCEADIILGNSTGDTPAIRITYNTSDENTPSYLDIQGLRVPMLILPVKTTGENPYAYVTSGMTTYPCMTVKNRHIEVGFNIFKEIGRILAGYYDSYFLGNDCLAMDLKALPVVDILEDCMISVLDRSAPDGVFRRRSLWPDGRRFVLVLTHDVDQVRKSRQYLPSFMNSLKKRSIPDFGYQITNLLFKHGKNDPYWTFEQMYALENSLGVKSTCYFLHETGRVNPLRPKSWVIYGGRYSLRSRDIRQQIMELREKGYEIGVHGSYNSYRNQQILNSEKKLVESIIGSEIAGIRQHYLNYDSSLTPSIHCNCGFKYDTSVGFKPVLGNGFRRGTSFPFPVMLSDFTISNQLEIPLIIMDTAIGRTSTPEECFSLMEQVERYSGVLTILWHTDKFNSREHPNFFELYKNIIREAQGRGAWVARAIDVNKWLTESDPGVTDRLSKTEIAV